MKPTHPFAILAFVLVALFLLLPSCAGYKVEGGFTAPGARVSVDDTGRVRVLVDLDSGK